MTYNMAIENCWEINLNYLWRRIFSVWLRLEELQILLFPYFYSLPSFRLWTENSCVLCSGIALLKSMYVGLKSNLHTSLSAFPSFSLSVFLSLESNGSWGYKIFPAHQDNSLSVGFIPAMPRHDSTKNKVLEIHFYRINLVQMRFFCFCF